MARAVWITLLSAGIVVSAYALFIMGLWLVFTPAHELLHSFGRGLNPLVVAEVGIILGAGICAIIVAVRGLSALKRVKQSPS